MFLINIIIITIAIFIVFTVILKLLQQNLSYLGFPPHLCLWSKEAFLYSIVHVPHWNFLERHSLEAECSSALSLSTNSSKQWEQQYLVVSKMLLTIVRHYLSCFVTCRGWKSFVFKTLVKVDTRMWSNNIKPLMT